jgi:hypothetical protein
MSENEEEFELDEAQREHPLCTNTNKPHKKQTKSQNHKAAKKRRAAAAEANNENDDSEEDFEYEDDEEYYKKFMEKTSNMPLNDEDDLRFQLRLEREMAEKQAKAANAAPTENEPVKTRVDPDGTVFEWDPAVKGWFPKLNENRFIEYLKSYGQGQANDAAAQKKAAEFRPAPNTNYFLSGAFFKWDFAENKWSNVTDPVYAYVDYMTGVEFEWNTEANAWKPKNQTIESNKPAETVKPAEKPPKQEKKEGWFQIDEDKNTNVYVSGLPLDTTDDEFEEIMSKYGIIMKDPLTSKLKLKLYRDENGEVKGDGRCCYLMPESVKLCLQLLDQSDFRGHTVSVEKAKFEMKGASFDPNKAAQANTVKKKKMKKSEERKLIDQQRQRYLKFSILYYFLFQVIAQNSFLV